LGVDCELKHSVNCLFLKSLTSEGVTWPTRHRAIVY
jgi:hypothetical protein